MMHDGQIVYVTKRGLYVHHERNTLIRPGTWDLAWTLALLFWLAVGAVLSWACCGCASEPLFRNAASAPAVIHAPGENIGLWTNSPDYKLNVRRN